MKEHPDGHPCREKTMDRGNNDDADRDQNLQGKRIDDATSKKVSTTTLKGKTEEFHHQDTKTQRHKLTLTNLVLVS